MARGKPRTQPPPSPRPRELLNRADTAATATSYERPPEPIPQSQRGERVDAPTAEMRGRPSTDWGKVSVWVAIGIFALGILITVIWNYADTVNSIKNLSSDVGDLKRRADDLFKSSVDATARLAALERRAQLYAQPIPAPTVPAASAPRRQ